MEKNTEPPIQICQIKCVTRIFNSSCTFKLWRMKSLFYFFILLIGCTMVLYSYSVFIKLINKIYFDKCVA